MWWKSFRTWWSGYKNVSAVRSLLQWIGIWDFCVRWFKRIIGGAVAAAATLIWSRFASQPGPTQFVLTLGAFAATLVIFTLIINIREKAAQRNAASHLSLLSATILSEYPHRPDLRGIFLIRAFFRNDSDKPIAIQFVKWDRPTDAFTFCGFRGSQIERPPADPRNVSRATNYEALSGNLMLHPNQAFRTTIEVRLDASQMLEDQQNLGRLTLLLDNRETPFVLQSRTHSRSLSNDAPTGANHSGPFFVYVEIPMQDKWKFEGRMSLCGLLSLVIRNGQTAIPETAVNVCAAITYKHADGRKVVVVDKAQWLNSNPITSSQPGRTLEECINLESNEEQKLVFLIEHDNGTYYASCQNGRQFQPLALGQWEVTVDITADNADRLKLHGVIEIISKQGRTCVDLKNDPISGKKFTPLKPSNESLQPVYSIPGEIRGNG